MGNDDFPVAFTFFAILLWVIAAFPVGFGEGYDSASNDCLKQGFFVNEDLKYECKFIGKADEKIN